MSATDELRRMLDERGVEWWNDTDPEPRRQTNVWVGEQLVMFHENVNGTVGYVVYSTHDLTPEQAIDVTLGNDGPERSKNGVERSSDGVAERGTCHDDGGTDENGRPVFNCDACGCVLSLYHRDGTNTMCTHYIYDYPRFCPACGRKVVGE